MQTKQVSRSLASNIKRLNDALDVACRDAADSGTENPAITNALRVYERAVHFNCDSSTGREILAMTAECRQARWGMRKI